jgi:hypothetical protein
MLESFDVIEVQQNLAQLGLVNAELEAAKADIVRLKDAVGGSG